jgi:hypothetical protein
MSLSLVEKLILVGAPRWMVIAVYEAAYRIERMDRGPLPQVHESEDRPSRAPHVL